MSIFIFWYPKVYIWMCTNHYARKSLMGTKKQKVRVEYLAMKIQLSPVTISPSMYIPLPLPHMPTKITKTRSNGLLQAAQTGSPPLTLSILTIFSPFSPCHKIVSLRLFPKFRSRLLNALRNECSVSTQWLARVFLCRRFLSADKIARLATSETKWSCCPTTWRASHLQWSPWGLKGGKAAGMDPGPDYTWLAMTMLPRLMFDICHSLNPKPTFIQIAE